MRASSAVWVWMVERRVTILTTSRDSISAESAAGSKPSSRENSWKYGGLVFWACRPTSRPTASFTGTVARRRSNCLSSVALLSARVESTGVFVAAMVRRVRGAPRRGGGTGDTPTVGGTTGGAGRALMMGR